MNHIDLACLIPHQSSDSFSLGLFERSGLVSLCVERYIVESQSPVTGSITDQRWIEEHRLMGNKLEGIKSDNDECGFRDVCSGSKCFLLNA